MNANILFVSLLWAGLVGPSPQETSEQEQPMRRVPSTAEYAAEWARDLRSSDLSARRRAYDQVLEGAERSPAVREAVQAWTQGDDLELAWTAELLLREIERQERATPSERWSPLRERLAHHLHQVFPRDRVAELAVGPPKAISADAMDGRPHERALIDEQTAEPLRHASRGDKEQGLLRPAPLDRRSDRLEYGPGRLASHHRCNSIVTLAW